MTPQEKANDLFNKMLDKAYEVDCLGGEYMVAKRCALVMVEEMINCAGYIWGGRDTETGKAARDSFRDYWYEVKNEIEKL
jgi:hypothetical protein